MIAVARALYAAMTADAQLGSVLASGTAVYQDIAPAGAALPYVIFNRQAGTPRFTFGGTAFRSFVYQVKALVSESAGGESAIELAEQADDRLRSVVTDPGLTLPGGDRVMVCRRMADVGFTEIDEGVRIVHRGGLYEIAVTPG